MKKILGLVLLLAIGFIAWMNLTPGYFQHYGCSGVAYKTDKEVIKFQSVINCTVENMDTLNVLDSLLIAAAQLDFNK